MLDPLWPLFQALADPRGGGMFLALPLAFVAFALVLRSVIGLWQLLGWLTGSLARPVVPPPPDYGAFDADLQRRLIPR